MYVVGLFIDSVKISESYGSSLEMAEIRVKLLSLKKIFSRSPHPSSQYKFPVQASRKALEDYFLSQVKQMNQEEVPEMDESLMEAEVIAE